MEGRGNARRSRFVISGCHQYDNLEDLPAVRNNLTKLMEVLSDPEIGGIEPDACTIVSQPSNPGILLDAIYDAAEECTGTLLFYYAGHGLTSFQNGDLSLATPGTSATRPHTSVRFDDVRAAVLSARKAPRKVVVLDCCFSGRAMAGSMSDPADLAATSEIAGTYILTAAAETKTALAPPGEAYTAFTGELLRLLLEGLPGAPEYLSLDLVYANLRDRLAAQSRPIPQQRNRNEGARIALARNVLFSPLERTSDRSRAFLDYSAAALRADIDAEEVRRKMNSVHLPYTERLNSARLLARLGPQFKSECISVVEGIYEANDTSGLDAVKALEIIAEVEPVRLTWVCDRLTEIASRSGSATYTLISRENACETLHKLGAQDAAIAGYRILLADPSNSLGRRVLTAQDMAKRVPQARDEAVQFMWQFVNASQVSNKDRIDTLRKICAVSPDQIPAASVMIENIMREMKSKAIDEAS
ncbi:caspase domain-containing protein [Streptomyces sp. NPDC006706]|uniref:caspase family protein n=1 Tax=Streptomyces sp. NPDC006706 TaxID=3364761 RepID=UPI00368AE651